jgi:formyltetrahydrofolate deformylase
MSQTVVLLISCPDQRGLVARVSTLLYEQGANILHADQHQDHAEGLFFMRVEWETEKQDLDDFRRAFKPLAEELGMKWLLRERSRPLRLALFVSQHLHCLADLLYRWKAGELGCEIPLVVSNHPDGRSLSEFYGIPFVYLPITASTKTAVEQKQLALVREHGVDLVVLARYMQILSPEFVRELPRRILNVHHSFLPAFIGAKPYHAAFARGVKLIGATSHYVTEILDDGPIIEQDVVRISHRDQVDDLIAHGRDLERVVLSRAVKWIVEGRILCYQNKTVVFD